MVRLVRAATDRNPPSLGGGGCQPVGKGIIRSGQRRIGFQDIMPWHDLRRVCCTARHHNTQIGSYTVQNHHRALLPDFRINGVPEIAYSDIAFCWCKFKSHLSPLPPAHSLTRRFGRVCQRGQRNRLKRKNPPYARRQRGDKIWCCTKSLVQIN